jgi:hypothetical protein
VAEEVGGGAAYETLDVGGWTESWLSASLDLVSVVELVTIVVGAELTGALVVQTRHGTRRLFFEEGRYHGARSNLREDRLGEVLWRSGKISLDQLMIAGESITKEKRIGRVLVELGYLEVGELRLSLRRQGRAVFEAACLDDEGRATFVVGEKNDNPVAFFEEPEEMIDEALTLIEDRERTLVQLGDIDSLFEVANHGRPGNLSEAEEALRQLAASAKEPLTGRQLMEKANLRGLLGLKALALLVQEGVLARIAPSFDGPPATLAPGDGLPRVKRLVQAIGIVMEQLDKGGFGLGDAVRDFCAEPPDAIADALAGVDVDKLDADAITKHGELFTEGGLPQLEHGLSLLLDFALFEARDAMEEDDVATLLTSIAHLGVLL